MKPSSPENCSPFFLKLWLVASVSTGTFSPPGPVTVTEAVVALRLFEPFSTYSRYVPARQTTCSLPGEVNTGASTIECSTAVPMPNAEATTPATPRTRRRIDSQSAGRSPDC
jgi:hypothetical protein